MFRREHSFLIRSIAALTLVLWSATVYHDVWLGALGVDHHHDSHAVAEHSHSHSHSHDHHQDHDDSEHDHRDSIPLTDTHSEVLTFSVAKSVIGDPKQKGDGNVWFFSGFDFLRSRSLRDEVEELLPQRNRDHDPPDLILLAHSVQSNAPPVRV